MLGRVSIQNCRHQRLKHLHSNKSLKDLIQFKIMPLNLNRLKSKFQILRKMIIGILMAKNPSHLTTHLHSSKTIINRKKQHMMISWTWQTLAVIMIVLSKSKDNKYKNHRLKKNHANNSLHFPNSSHNFSYHNSKLKDLTQAKIKMNLKTRKKRTAFT